MGLFGKCTLVGLTLCLVVTGAVAQDPSTLPYMNTKLSLQERAADWSIA